jgi:uroporphyrinogen-III decarboxylase
MGIIGELIKQYKDLFRTDENNRRLSLWDRPEEGIRGEFQWHGIPSYTTETGRPMPVTAECLDKIWEKLLGLDLARYFTEPDYYLEHYLKIKIRKFQDFPDDTPLTMDIPLVFGVTHEAGILGQGIVLDSGEEPSFAKGSIVDENTDFPKEFDFSNNPYLNDIAIPFYERIKEQAGDGFHVIFPHWYRGPQGVALYIRGFQEFSLDLYINPEFAHRLLRYVTDAAKAFNLWRTEYTGDPIMPGDLFNDDIPLMSPDMYRDFFYRYEKEMSDFFGGIFYWHSCGDITPHVQEIHKLHDIDVLDFGVTMEDKLAGLNGLNRNQTLEIRVMAQTHVQQCSEEESKAYIRTILEECRSSGIDKYVLRSSGMSVVDGAATDAKKLGRWVELVREVQKEFLV